MAAVRTQVFATFDDPAIGADVWSGLLGSGDTDELSLTWQSQRLWWQANRHQRTLALIAAEQEGKKTAIGPLFVDSGMAINLCPVQAVDFVGDVSDPEVLDAILQTARDQVGDFNGFRFYHVPDTSRTGEWLQQAAKRLDLDCFLEDEQPSPIIDISGNPEAALACTTKKTMLRREKHLRRTGQLDVRHFHKTPDVLEQLEDYFDLHIERWEATPTPSKFN